MSTIGEKHDPPSDHSKQDAREVSVGVTKWGRKKSRAQLRLLSARARRSAAREGDSPGLMSTRATEKCVNLEMPRNPI